MAFEYKFKYNDKPYDFGVRTWANTKNTSGFEIAQQIKGFLNAVSGNDARNGTTSLLAKKNFSVLATLLINTGKEIAILKGLFNPAAITYIVANAVVYGDDGVITGAINGLQSGDNSLAFLCFFNLSTSIGDTRIDPNSIAYCYFKGGNFNRSNEGSYYKTIYRTVINNCTLNRWQSELQIWYTTIRNNGGYIMGYYRNSGMNSIVGGARFNNIAGIATPMHYVKIDNTVTNYFTVNGVDYGAISDIAT